MQKTLKVLKYVFFPLWLQYWCVKTAWACLDNSSPDPHPERSINPLKTMRLPEWVRSGLDSYRGWRFYVNRMILAFQPQ